LGNQPQAITNNDKRSRAGKDIGRFGIVEGRRKFTWLKLREQKRGKGGWGSANLIGSKKYRFAGNLLGECRLGGGEGGGKSQLGFWGYTFNEERKASRTFPLFYFDWVDAGEM